MNTDGQGPQPETGSRRGLEAWAFWVLASAIGGAVGGLASEPLGIDGYLLLPGLGLGAAQALVLRRYLSDRAVGPWVAASFVGWSAGLVLVFLLALLLAGLFGAGEVVPEFTERAGPVIAEID